jgi:hypothetical protein
MQLLSNAASVYYFEADLAVAGTATLIFQQRLFEYFFNKRTSTCASPLFSMITELY